MDFQGTVAEKNAVMKKKQEKQQDRPSVMCEGEKLKNVFLFKYLGSIFAADGSQEPDLKRRIGIADTRMGQLRHLFNSSQVPLATKLKLYEAAVVSLFTYGCEAWTLTPKTIRKINGANSRLLARITRRTVHEEARSPSYDIIRSIRYRRLVWLGHILRLKKVKQHDNSGNFMGYAERLVKTAVQHQHAEGYEGSLLMDASNLD